MRIPRIFHHGTLRVGEPVVLSPDAVRHAITVLRLRTADRVILFNGEGGEYPAELVEVSRQQTVARPDGYDARSAESPLRITLLQGVSKGERMDFTIQKAVELGVTRIVPVNCARSVVQLDGKRLLKRQEHWRGIAIGGCEQSGRNTLPAIDGLCDLPTALGRRDGLGLLLDHVATEGAGTLRLAGEVTLLIGPEGGLTDEEKAAAVAAGFIPIRFGPRVLRTETAALAAISALQVLAGDFR